MNCFGPFRSNSEQPPVTPEPLETANSAFQATETTSSTARAGTSKAEETTQADDDSEEEDG